MERLFEAKIKDLNVATGGSPELFDRFQGRLNETSINRRLSLREMNISLNTAEVLRDLLQSNKKIIHLDLCKNMLSDKGVTIIA